MFQKNISENRRKENIRRKVYKIYLEDLQDYFHYLVFYFDEYYNHKDYDEVLVRKYEEQALRFLRRIGAMLSVDTFLTISEQIVYVRKLPPGIELVQEEL